MAGASLQAFAQGTVSFQDVSGGPLICTNNPGGPNGLAKDGNFVVALYWAAGAGHCSHQSVRHHTDFGRARCRAGGWKIQWRHRHHRRGHAAG